MRWARLIASMYIDRIGNIHSRGTLRCTRMRGSHCAAVASSIGGSLRRNLLSRCRFQKSAKARARSRTAGPVIRQCVSRHSVAYAEPML